MFSPNCSVICVTRVLYLPIDLCNLGNSFCKLIDEVGKQPAAIVEARSVVGKLIHRGSAYITFDTEEDW